MPTRHKKSGFMSAFTFLLLIGAGIFIGALIASPTYRDETFTRIKESRPVQYIIESWERWESKRVHLALALPSGKSAPGLRRNQHR
jgi:hypothetical protein